GHAANDKARFTAPAGAAPPELPPPLEAVSDGGAPPPPADSPAPAPLVPAEALADRDPRSGRFTTGNKAGQGNPFAGKLGAMRSAFLEAVSADQVKELARNLVAMALAGDVPAAKLVLLYALGRPTAAVDPDGLDMQEWRLRQDCPRLG